MPSTPAGRTPGPPSGRQRRSTPTTARTQTAASSASAPNTAYAQYFTGESFLNPLTDPTKTVFLANVTFSPACRNNWHIHHAKSGGGQLLLCTDGLGWYQEAGKRAQALHPGDVVTIPAGVKHWHGAQKDCWFSHIAIECPGEETSNEWLEPVTDAEYAALDADCAQNP
ncbi:MAG: cupin domain-containing protein [Oscillospiraceae bacterium]